MKKRNVFQLLLLSFVLILSSCNSDEPIQEAIENGAPFEAVFRIPLETNNEITGESAIIDNEGWEKHNKAELFPVVRDIVKSIEDGKLAVHPPYEPIPDYDPSTYAAKEYARMREYEPGFGLKNMVQCVEVFVDGLAYSTKSEMNPSHLRIIYTDLGQVLPDRNMFLVKMEDLQSYQVESAYGRVDLKTYLRLRNFENYVISVNDGDQFFGARQYEDAVEATDLIEGGQLQKVLSFYPPRKPVASAKE